jgi:hypothetical protein
MAKVSAQQVNDPSRQHREIYRRNTGENVDIPCTGVAKT